MQSIIYAIGFLVVVSLRHEFLLPVGHAWFSRSAMGLEWVVAFVVFVRVVELQHNNLASSSPDPILASLLSRHL